MDILPFGSRYCPARPGKKREDTDRYGNDSRSLCRRKRSRCLSVLGAGQIDQYGNINSTKTGSGKFLVGSGGANDAVNAREVIVVLKQSKDRFAEKLSFVTGQGNAVTTVISTMGVFRKENPGGILRLEGCFPGTWAPDLEEKIKLVESQCGVALGESAED